ncbi:hypothetical protein FA95DRAFT_1552640 [Auriscalpium vulgare]|uniref:Uncharacterized protein n=1 Tax=Auriscalpium vulgare TaxID=40419 RepID=A0ACB8S9R9_9AGAM|nr:hypothetical protein FA95DRAFT_1552640 [Auriscalpium vulgare]
MSAESMTARPHEDIIGSDTSNMHNIPGAENATSGHHYVATRPIDDGVHDLSMQLGAMES